MTVNELIKKLQTYPSNARVILIDEAWAKELEPGRISFEEMNYIEYKPYWEHHPLYYGWEYPSEYDRKVLKTEKVVTIS